MRKVIMITAFSLLGLSGAAAQSADPNMLCPDYVKMMDQVAKASGSADTTGDDTMKKIADYCKAHPTAKASEAMEKALTAD